MKKQMIQLSMDDFCAEVENTMNSLPSFFYEHLENLVVEVEDFPSKKTLKKAHFSPAEIREGNTLFGLFEPMELSHPWAGDAIDIHSLTHKLTIYKKPHEESFPDPIQLKIEIRKTVIHELAHHFGLSDKDLENFDNNPNPFSKDISLTTKECNDENKPRQKNS
jgi:predicted Zn-dependent protease with MMP-like domain